MASISTVLVLGASGSVGPSIVSALLSSPQKFKVSVLTREESKATFSTQVTVFRTDYSEQSLLSAFRGIDAIVSSIATFSTHQQAAIIDAAIASGVKRFLPSEYGIDTSQAHVVDILPPAADKVKTVQYLKSKEYTGLTWTAVIVGGFFDWSFQFPGLMGWNVPAKQATVFDGGDVKYEATNVEQIGRAVAAVLAPENLDETANKYIFVNSFTTTQNEVVAALEKATGEKFEIAHVKGKDVAKAGLEQLKTPEFETLGGGSYLKGSVEVIHAAIYGYGGCNNYSRVRHGDGSEAGVSNERLGLPRESVEETIKSIVRGGE